jgi:hypothetical protein
MMNEEGKQRAASGALYAAVKLLHKAGYSVQRAYYTER